MHKRLWFLLAGAVIAVMAYGLVGVGAVFTDRWTATQEIHIGELTVEVSSSTPGAVIDAPSRSILFPDVAIGGSSTPLREGAPDVTYDQFRIRSTGTIPAHLSVRVFVETGPGVEDARFSLVRKGASGPETIQEGLPVSDVVIDGPTAGAAHDEIADAIGLVWHDLTNQSMGGTIRLRLVIDATE